MNYHYINSLNIVFASGFNCSISTKKKEKTERSHTLQTLYVAVAFLNQSSQNLNSYGFSKGNLIYRLSNIIGFQLRKHKQQKLHQYIHECVWYSKNIFQQHVHIDKNVFQYYTTMTFNMVYSIAITNCILNHNPIENTQRNSTL